MKILHTADIHLREYGDKRWKALQDLITIGKNEKIEVFAISGDLFDRDVNADDLRPKIRELFSNNGFKIVIVPGNHDSESYIGGKYFGEDVTVLTDLDKPFEYKDVNFWGFPFKLLDGREILNALHSLSHKLSAEKKNILLYHGELLDAVFSKKDFGEENETSYMPVKLSYFRDLNFEYVLAGHFHTKFDVWKLENGGYFVYPGSPISITKRETGRRKINIFEVGKPPQEHPIDTPYYEEVVIEFNPLSKENPLDIVKKTLEGISRNANIILTIRGYVDFKDKTENEFAKEIKNIVKDRCATDDDLRLEFKDIHNILEDDLFRRFLKKVEEKDYDEEKKKELIELTLRAMADTRL
ncbi:MAG: metallophosphoesterase [Candidatus Bilamarchaeaceae archaeon]